MCNLTLKGLSHEYKTLRETLVMFCPNDLSFIETKVRERYLDLQAQGGSKKHSCVALVSWTERKSSKNHNNKPKFNSESDLSRNQTFQGSVSSAGRRVTRGRTACLTSSLIPHRLENLRPTKMRAVRSLTFLIWSVF